MLTSFLRWAALVAAGIVVISPTPPVARAQQSAQQQQTQKPVFRSEVDLVRVDVQVVDSKGVPILGLGLDDFKVALDGSPRKVVDVELVQFEQPPPGQTDPIFTPGRVPEDARIFVIAVDQMGLATAAVAPMKDAVRRFLRQLRPQDMVGLYEFPFRAKGFDINHDRSLVSRALDGIMGMRELNPGSMDLSPSEVVDISANDVDVLNRVYIRECTNLSTTEVDIGCMENIRMEARAIAGHWENEAAQRMNELARLAQNLQGLQGRKTIVLISNGLVSSHRPGGRPDVQSMMKQVGDDVANAQANLYVLHLDTTFMEAYSATARSGMNSIDRFQNAGADRTVQTQGLEILAGRAGGDIFSVEAGTPDYVFDRVLRETTSYYAIGVEPTDSDRDGKSHYINVKTTAGRATVRSRVQVSIPKK
jgi:VWFA-related protein